MASVRVEVREGRGRCLVAGKRFELGDVIVSHRPYEAVLEDADVAKRCHYTFAAAENLMTCKRCKFARYSSPAAQEAAWPAHKPECRALKAFTLRSGREVPDPAVRLAARILWKRARQEVDGSSAPWDSYADVESLQTHWDNFSAELKRGHIEMGLLTRQYMAARGTQPGSGGDAGSSTNADAGEGAAVKEVALLLSRLLTNKRPICKFFKDGDGLEIFGAGIYPLLAMANHSCTPNAAETCEANGRISFRAIAPISPGDEVTIAYIELLNPRSIRRMDLLADFYFDIDEGQEQPTWRSVEAHAGGLQVSVASQPPPLDPSEIELTKILTASGEELTGSGLAFLYSETLSASVPAHPSRAIECWGPAFEPGGCFQDGPGMQQLLAQLKELEFYKKATKAALNSGRWADALEALASANRAADGEGLEAAVKLPFSHMGRLILHTLARLPAAIGHVHGNSWDVALDGSRRWKAIMSIAYPRVWPGLGLAYAEAAKLENEVLNLPEGVRANLQYARLCPNFARAYATASLRILEIIHHPDSELLNFLSSLQSKHQAANLAPDCDDPHIGLLEYIA